MIIEMFAMSLDWTCAEGEEETRSAEEPCNQVMTETQHRVLME